MAVKTPRRHALLKFYAASARLDLELAGVWRAKQLAAPGAALPPTFPSLAKLTAAKYTTQQDLDGADAAELLANAKLTRKEAEAVLTALAQL